MIIPLPRYAELATTTNFSFLRGASHPEELVATAIELQHCGIGVADRNSVAGVVRAFSYLRAHKVAREDFRLAVGARLVFADKTPDLLCYPQDRAAYGRLCRLLTRGHMRAEKGDCALRLDDLLDFTEGQQLIALGQAAPPKALASACKDRLWLGATALYGPDMREGLLRRAAQAERLSLPLVAVNDAHYHVKERRPLADALACIREGATLEDAGFLLAANAERHLKSAAEMGRLFAQAPHAVDESARFLERLSFRLEDLAYEYPSELREGFASEQEALEFFAREGARTRYPDGVPAHVAALLERELKLIGELSYAAYFLTVHDIMRFARSQNILAQGRGSAANSAVCFCLGVTEVDPTRHDLLFERFVSAERNEPPDIDVDFEHERREEVIQYIYRRFGRDHAGLAAAVVTYRSRSAMREIGKIFGLSNDLLAKLSHLSSAGGDMSQRRADMIKLGLDPSEPRFALALERVEELRGFPRHLTQHSGGFVITRTRLDEVVPVAPAAMEGRTTILWDKDDLDALGLLKIDVLALGMLTCLRKGLDLLSLHYGLAHRLSSIPAEDPRVYAMISRADTVGVFQIESRAQMSMLPRLKPNCFYDLVIEVAIVRPGPIQGDMVHPYLRRRMGKEKLVFPSKELEEVLGKTLGVPLFQEQAMRIAIVGAGFSPEEADQLRRAMATFKRAGLVSAFREKMISGMVSHGYEEAFAERCFAQIEGFGTYGFPESHAASFALLVYASSWLKCRYPDVFACALLNSQPMGFYAPAQILRDAQDHGVPTHEVCVNASDWDCTLEPASAPGRLHARHQEMEDDIRGGKALRLGFREVKGVSEADMRTLVARRGRGYDSVRDLWLRTGLAPAVLERLAEADAFASLGLSRREALWAAAGLNRAGDKDDLPLLSALAFEPIEPDAKLPPMPLGEEVIEDYRALSLSLRGHPVAFLRGALTAKGIATCADMARLFPSPRLGGESGRRPDEGRGRLAPMAPPPPAPHPAPLPASGERGRLLPRATVAGLVLMRQRPATAKGVIFMTIEDETGSANVIIWPKLFEKQRAEVLGARLVAVTGDVQEESGVIHLIARKVEDITPLLRKLEKAHAAMPKARNFH